MRNTFFVSIQCPECGGSIRFPEGAYTFKCSFCGSVLRVKGEGVDLKYIIPSRLNPQDVLIAIKKIILSRKEIPGKLKKIKRIKTFYKPFWYFKGMIYSCYSQKGGSGRKEENEVESKTAYHTFPANLSFVNSLQSLGLRAETLAIEAYDSERFKEEGVMVPVTVSREEAVKRAEKFSQKKFNVAKVGPLDPKVKYLVLEKLAEIKRHASTSGKSYAKTNIIGEKFFILYYPVVQVLLQGGDYFHTFLLDGINKNLLEEGAGRGDDHPAIKEEASSCSIKLLSHRCENCGYDLEPRDFDIIFYCKNCFRLWLLKRGEYRSQKIKVLETEKKENVVYVPFWRLEAVISSKSMGSEIKTIGDLSRFMKIGQYLLRKEKPERPIRFFIPALVSKNARALIKLAARIGSFQKELPVSQREDFPFVNFRNASLSEEEAMEMLWPLIFMVIGRVDQKAINFYNDFEFSITDRQLVWYPFEEKGNYFIDHYHDYHFPRRSLDVRVYS